MEITCLFFNRIHESSFEEVLMVFTMFTILSMSSAHSKPTEFAMHHHFNKYKYWVDNCIC